MLWLLGYYFYGTPEYANKWVFAIVSCGISWTLFFMFVFFSIQICKFYFYILYYILFYFIIISQKPVCFLMRDRKGVILNEKGHGEEVEE